MGKVVLRKSLSTLIIIAMFTTMFTLPTLSNNYVNAASKTKINKKEAKLYVGKTFKLKVTKSKKDKKKKIKWSSNKKSVASVSKKGVVTAKKVGNATITAKVGKKKLKCKVTVKALTPNGTVTRPFIATSGVTNNNPRAGLHTFTLTKTYRNEDALAKVKTLVKNWGQGEQEDYENTLKEYDYVIFEFDVNAVNSKGIVFDSDIVRFDGAYTIGCEGRVKSKHAGYYSNVGDNYTVDNGTSGKIYIIGHVPKGSNYFMNFVYGLNNSIKWIRYDY